MTPPLLDQSFVYDDLPKIAKKILPHLSLGTVVILNGEMGSGKTTLMQAIAHALHANAPVTSPTYTLVNTYLYPKGTLYHLDLYRLETEQDCFSLDIDRYLNQKDGITFIEWGCKMNPKWLSTYLTISLSYTHQFNKRHLRIDPFQA